MTKEPGAASILIELEDGKINIRHGTDGVILFHGNEVKEGTWEKLFDAVKQIILENNLKSILQ